VGYAKTPKHTRWPKGQSGNSAGRPKGAKNLSTIIEDELKAEVMVTENGRPRRMSRQEAMVLAQIMKAIKGDTRAFGAIVKLALQYAGDDGEEDEKPLSRAEQETLGRMLARLGKGDGGDGDD
jgi:hypothetical protein